MAQVIVRNLDEDVKTRPQARAVQHGQGPDAPIPEQCGTSNNRKRAIVRRTSRRRNGHGVVAC